MKENFNIDCTVQKAASGNGHRIYIRVDSMERLRKLVAPYFTPSMLYKLREN